MKPKAFFFYTLGREIPMENQLIKKIHWSFRHFHI